MLKKHFCKLEKIIALKIFSKLTLLKSNTKKIIKSNLKNQNNNNSRK